LLRERIPFYNPESLHDDTEACYEILATRKFGFVHQLLTYIRVDETSEYGRTQGWNPQGLDKLICLMKYGPVFLNARELRVALRTHERAYYGDYVRHLFSPGCRDFMQYHQAGHRRVGYRIRPVALLSAALRELANILLNPLLTVLRLRAALRERLQEERKQSSGR
jgi:hypothetical protein